MKREDITHLASLSRLRLSDVEVDQLETELPKIVKYVSVINDIAAQSSDDPKVGARCNVLRTDEVTNGADEFTQDILNEMPDTDGRFMKVKKILKQD